MNRSLTVAARSGLAEAVRVAPHFGLAHARLAEAWVELDTPEKASQQMILAQREDTSELSKLDRLQTEAIGFTITREFADAVGKYELMEKPTPEDADLYVDLGRAYEKAGQPAKAIESYRHAAESSSHNPAAWLHLAILYSQASDVPKSVEAFRRADELYQLTSNLEGLTEVAHQRGLAANRRGQFDEAAVQLRKALETARVAGNIQQEIRAKLQLSTTAYSSGDTALAESYAREALDNARVNQMETLAIRGVIGLGNAYRRKLDLTGAEKYYQEALWLARRSSPNHLAAFALSSLASLHDQLKRSEDSTREAQEALAFYEPNRYAKESLQCLGIIGRAQRYRGNYSAALQSFQRLLDTAELIQDRQQMGLAHESLGNVFFVQELYPDALEHFKKSLELYPDAEHLGYAGLGCGDALWRLGRYPEADARFSGVDVTAEKFPSIRLYLMQNRAEMYLSEMRYKHAAATARRAIASDTAWTMP